MKPRTQQSTKKLKIRLNKHTKEMFMRSARSKSRKGTNCNQFKYYLDLKNNFSKVEVKSPPSMTTINTFIPVINFASKIVYSDPLEAVKALNANKIVQNEFNKTIETIRMNKMLEISHAKSTPSLIPITPKNDGSVNVRPLDANTISVSENLKLLSQKAASYKSMPRIRVK